MADEKHVETREKKLEIRALEEEKSRFAIEKRIATIMFQKITNILKQKITLIFYMKFFPPIFGSQLFRKTPPIQILSKSLPNLNTILW